MTHPKPGVSLRGQHGDLLAKLERRQAVAAFEARSGILPVPIRLDCVVRFSGLPHDLTKAEAEKIGRVVMALAAGNGGDL